METKEALFSLGNYRIVESSFNLRDVSSMDKLCLDFNPSGIYNLQSSVYNLVLELNILFEGKKVISVKLESDYKFKDALKYEDIPIFFYSNCIAIVFPYIRAFISTVSLQANVKPIIIPTLNIQPLGDLLRKRTTINE